MAEQRRGHVQDQREEDLAKLGLASTPDQARAWLQQLDAGDAQPDDADPTAAGGPPLVLWPENHDAWRLWMRLQRQWRRDHQGRLYALRLGEAESAMRMMKLWPRRAELFDALTEMEVAALATLDESEHDHGA